MLNENEISAIWISIKVALFCSAISLPLAVIISSLLCKGNFKGKSLLDAIVHLPLVLPPVTVGYVLLMILGINGPVGKLFYKVFGVRLAFCFTGAVIASIVVSMPLFVRAIRSSMEMIDSKIVVTARQLGASRLRTFMTITLPLCIPGIIGGLVLSFARSLGEFGATMSFAANIEGETRTLPMAIYTMMNSPGREDAAMRLALISIVISIIAFLASEIILRKNRVLQHTEK